MFCIMFDLALYALHHVALSSYTTLYALDLVHVELESEVKAEQVQAKDLTNLALDQGKTRCIPRTILGFSLITIFMLYLIVH
jgi:hypothetical protein